jgi:ssDNA-binding Zn-finger/Zn-ribbon topoisomerase 1
VQVSSSDHYKLRDLVHLFQLAFDKARKVEVSNDDTSTDSAPFCPECGLVMVLRVHREGRQAGKRYYGCMNAPTCDGIIEID